MFTDIYSLSIRENNLKLGAPHSNAENILRDDMADKGYKSVILQDYSLKERKSQLVCHVRVLFRIGMRGSQGNGAALECGAPRAISLKPTMEHLRYFWIKLSIFIYWKSK